MRVRDRVQFAFALLFLSTTYASAQCDWIGRLAQAVENRYNRDDSACKALQIPGEEFNEQWAVLETKALERTQFVYAPEQSRLQDIAQKYLRDAGINGLQEPVAISADGMPNAFATGQRVTLHQGIVDWYMRPQTILSRLGADYNTTAQFIDAYGRQNPGELGLLAIVAHETAHNILGHPDAFTMTKACNRYIDSAIRDIHDYEAQISTGKRPGGFKSAMKNMLVGFAQTFQNTQERQEYESQADRLGAWLVWRETGDPYAMAKSLRWLSMFPGMNPRGSTTAVFEALCSDHPMLQQRIAAVEAQAYSMQANQFPSGLKRAPMEDVKNRYEKYVKWSQGITEGAARIARGDLTDEERRIQKRIRLETKPKKAQVSIDGAPEFQAPADIELGLGPHNLRIQSEEISWEQEIVVLPDAPEKMKVEKPKR